MQASPFLLQLGDSIYATVTATNVYGESSASSEGNGATLLTVPDRPVGLSTNIATNTKSVITVTWNNGLSTGGSPIIDYRLSWDASTGAGLVYSVLATGLTSKSYTTTQTLTAGAFYTFRVEARNSVGYSLMSSSYQILAA